VNNFWPQNVVSLVRISLIGIIHIVPPIIAVLANHLGHIIDSSNNPEKGEGPASLKTEGIKSSNIRY